MSALSSKQQYFYVGILILRARRCRRLASSLLNLFIKRSRYTLAVSTVGCGSTHSLFVCIIVNPAKDCSLDLERKVCGEDRKTYNSECDMSTRGIPLAYYGPCKEECVEDDTRVSYTPTAQQLRDSRDSHANKSRKPYRYIMLNHASLYSDVLITKYDCDKDISQNMRNRFDKTII